MSDSDTYVEKRVRVKIYGTTASDSAMLVPVPGVQGKSRRLHKLAAEAMTRMAEAIKADLGIELALASGWRRHRWKSRQHYEETVIKRFGSVKEGRKWLAYDSPHETGLAMDIGVGGLWPTKKTRKAQQQEPLHKWLVAHAHEYGWHPYKQEPWHWEFPMSLEAFRSGVIGPDDPGPPEEMVSFGPGEEEEEDVYIEEADDFAEDEDF